MAADTSKMDATHRAAAARWVDRSLPNISKQLRETLIRKQIKFTTDLVHLEERDKDVYRRFMERLEKREEHAERDKLEYGQFMERLEEGDEQAYQILFPALEDQQRDANRGCTKLDEEFLQLIKLRDKRLAKNARVEYIDGKKYEWSPGAVADQRSASLSATFAPTPNYYGVLDDSDDAVRATSAQQSRGTINREQEAALVINRPTDSKHRAIKIDGDRHPVRTGP